MRESEDVRIFDSKYHDYLGWPFFGMCFGAYMGKGYGIATAFCCGLWGVSAAILEEDMDDYINVSIWIMTRKNILIESNFR